MYKLSFISKSENSSHATLEMLDEPKLTVRQDMSHCLKCKCPLPWAWKSNTKDVNVTFC
jgi:hypothetical protein